ncbi:MAG: TolC family protein [Planctomycetia bacterium]|nr:TolC family protein [Planctomycetia bacterium]
MRWVAFLVWGSLTSACVTGCASLNERIDFQLPPSIKSSAPEQFPNTLKQPVGHWPASRGAAPVLVRDPGTIRQASLQFPAGQVGQLAPTEPVELPLKPETIDDFVRLAVERNPRLARATIAIDAARGRYIQAGLYPNPDFAVNWDEIGDRQDAGGILTIPRITQTIVTGKKLTLSQAVAAREVDQTTLELMTERYAVVGSVRAAFYEVFALQRRAEILAELVKLADDAVTNGKKLLDNKQIARLDLIQLEVERERFRAELQAVRRELPGAYRNLAAVAGNHALIPNSVVATFDNLPAYDPDRTRETVLAYHPQVRAAHIAVEKAQAAVRRAEVEPIPNVSLSAGFVRQFENKSYDGAVGFSIPVPVWNRNQGNIRAAKAELGMAIQAVGQIENELAAQVAVAFQTYAAARERAEIYRTELIPRAEETYKLSLTAFKGGQFEYLRVIQAQRAVAEALLEYNKSLGEAWRAAAELSGLLLEEVWPNPPREPAPMPMLPPDPLPKGAKAP